MRMVCDAVIIRVKRLEEQDRLLTLLTRDKGVIVAYAKGAGRLKGSMVSSTELLCYSHFGLGQRGDRYFVDSAESNSIFFGLRQSLEKLSLATYFCQLCCELVPPLACDEGYLRLLLNTLHQLEKDKLAPPLLRPLFELRVLAMSGYMPDLVACCSCGEVSDDGMWFSPNEGLAFCQHCHSTDHTGMLPVPPGVFAAMRHIIYSDFERLFAFRLTPEGAAELGRICKAYLLAQVERVLPALSYYEAIVGLQN